MIDNALASVISELNAFLNAKFALGEEERAILSNLVNLDGSVSVKDENRVVVSFISIEQERLATPKVTNITPIGGKEPIYLNVFVLFSMVFNESLNMEALKFLSAVISFFQSKNVFTPQNTPRLDNSVEKLTFEIFNQTFHEQSNMWSFLGAKYVPSILYKVRLIVIDEGAMTFEVSDVSGLDPDFEQR